MAYASHLFSQLQPAAAGQKRPRVDGDRSVAARLLDVNWFAVTIASVLQNEQLAAHTGALR